MVLTPAHVTPLADSDEATPPLRFGAENKKNKLHAGAMVKALCRSCPGISSDQYRAVLSTSPKSEQKNIDCRTAFECDSASACWRYTPTTVKKCPHATLGNLLPPLPSTASFLCGKDRRTNKDYTHRKRWLTRRLFHLAQYFAVEIDAYAIMSNHFHLVGTRCTVKESCTG